jgi:hypothetical protein
MSTARWFLVSLVLVSSGCATSSPPDAPTVNETGTWAGIWACPQCPPLHRKGAMRMRLVQTGMTVTGNMSWDGGAPRPGGRVEGNVSRGVLLFRAPGIDLNGELSVNEDDMDGWGRSEDFSISISLHRYK